MFFVACGALTPFTLISVVEDIEIMVTDPAPEDVFVQIVVKPDGMFMALAELSAFNVHNTFLGLFILRPCRGSY